MTNTDNIEPVRNEPGVDPRSSETASRDSIEATTGKHEAPVDSVDDRAAYADHNGRSVREDVVAREKEEFGGFKFGSAFFGWLTATGTAVLLTALVAGAGAAVGLSTTDATSSNADTIGIVGLVAVLVVLFIAYYCGGYVAGRMARFSGAKQGLAVWLWALVVAIVLAIVGAIAGANLNVLANLNAFPRLPINEGDLSVIGIITAAGALVVSLIAAVVGGLAGMRYHRRIDRVGLGR